MVPDPAVPCAGAGAGAIAGGGVSSGILHRASFLRAENQKFRCCKGWKIVILEEFIVVERVPVPLREAPDGGLDVLRLPIVLSSSLWPSLSSSSTSTNGLFPLQTIWWLQLFSNSCHADMAKLLNSETVSGEAIIEAYHSVGLFRCYFCYVFRFSFTAIFAFPSGGSATHLWPITAFGLSLLREG